MATPKKNRIYPIWPAGVTEEGRLVINHPKEFRAHLVPYHGNLDMEIIIRPARKHRSRKEEKYYHGVVCVLVGQELGITAAEAHEFLKAMFLKVEESVELPGKKKIRYERVRSTTELDDERYHRYIFDEILPWASLPTRDEGLGPDSGLELEIPLPEKVEYSGAR